MSREEVSPWVGMWFHPRPVMRRILDSHPERHILLLAALSGVTRALDRATYLSPGDRMGLPEILGLSIIGGAISGMILLYVGAWVIRWTGKPLGGTGTPQAIRSAMAWSNVVTIGILGLWVVQLSLFGKEMFSTATPRIDGNLLLTISFLGLVLLQVVLSIWWYVVFLKCLAEAQGFSAWKALANSVLAALVIVVPLMVLTSLGTSMR